MATFIQAVLHLGPRLTRLPRLWLGAPAVRLADVAGVRTGGVMRAGVQPLIVDRTSEGKASAKTRPAARHAPSSADAPPPMRRRTVPPVDCRPPAER